MNDFDLVLSIEGMTHQDETRLLMKLAAEVPADLAIVEIGSWRGRTSAALAIGAREGNGAKVFAVDPFVDYTGRGVNTTFFYPADNVNHFWANLERAGVKDQVTLIQKTGIDGAKVWKKKKKEIGLLFIDGNHEYEFVKADFEAWEPFVAVDGMICMHDLDEPGVQRVYAEAVATGRFEQLPSVDLTYQLRELRW
jgi:predicted O-methyltransferase YrrM